MSQSVSKVAELQRAITQVIVGQEALVERLLIAMLAAGHVLLEGVPGLAKTTAVRVLAQSMALQFQRIQFTPDLIPGDITGTDIYLPHEGRFEFAPGPIFSDIVLADEINRAPPKVQSALLEAMQEHSVSAGGVTRSLSPVFMVMATQNPIEQEGTYPLPEAQLDRFLLKVDLDYPSAENELIILQRDTARRRTHANTAIAPIYTRADIAAARQAVNDIYMDQMLERYIVALVGATRAPERWDTQVKPWLMRGASPRATLALAHAARARAWLLGRDFVEPADIVALAGDILCHRLTLTFTACAEAITPRQVVARLLECVPIP